MTKKSQLKITIKNPTKTIVKTTKNLEEERKMRFLFIDLFKGLNLNGQREKL